MPQKLVGAPVPRQFHRSSPQVAVILLQFCLEPAEERERIRCRSRKSGHNLVVVQAADLLGGVLDYRLTQRDLPVAGQNDFAIAANR